MTPFFMEGILGGYVHMNSCAKFEQMPGLKFRKICVKSTSVLIQEC